MADITFSCIGTASGYPVIDRASSSHVLRDEQGNSYLFDIGGGATKNLLRFRVEYSNIKALFISHLHPDHWNDFTLLIQMLHLFERKEDLDVYLPEEGISTFEDMMEMSYLWEEKLTFSVNFHPISTDEQGFYQSEFMDIKAVRNNHLHQYESGKTQHGNPKLESFSFQVDFHDKAIVLSGDIDSLDDIEDICEKGMDLLVCESMHYSLDDLEDFLLQYKFDDVILTHIPPEREGLPSVAPDVHWAFDGFEIRL